MAEKLEYTSKYDGKTSDAIMDYSNKLRQQTSATDADTVQVFDTSGNPHKISKTELLKKSALALPSLNDISAFVAVNQAGNAMNDISAFVAVNQAGNAIGLMTKQQVATVLGELIGTVNLQKDGLMPKKGFIYRFRLNDNADWNTITDSGYYLTSGNNTHYTNAPKGYHYGILRVYRLDLGQILQIYIEDANPSTIHTRTYFIDRWNVWTKYAGVKNEST